MPTALIFTDKVLSFTQTFVQSQVEALRAYTPRYVGLSQAAPSLEIQGSPILLTTHTSPVGPWTKEQYKWTGIAPGFHSRVRRLHADLIHAHFGENGPAAMWLAEATKLPLILSLHGGAEILPDRTLRRERPNLAFYLHRRRLWRRASLFLCVSEFVRQKAFAHGFPPERLITHYTGIDCNLFAPCRPSYGEELVLYVGRLVRYKAADHFLKAMQIVRNTRPHARAVVIGDGPLRAECEGIAQELNLDCRFLGQQTSSTVREWMGKAAVFCAPSLTSASDGRAEALGHVFLEAQAMGIPVVSYRHGGIPEAVRHQETGLLATEGDIDELAACILRYLENPEYRRATGARGIVWVQTHFDVAKQNESLEALYLNVCSSYSTPVVAPACDPLRRQCLAAMTTPPTQAGSDWLRTVEDRYDRMTNSLAIDIESSAWDPELPIAAGPIEESHSDA